MFSFFKNLNSEPLNYDLFLSSLNNPTSGHLKDFAGNLANSVLEDSYALSLIHTILRSGCFSLALTLFLQTWLLATFIFPSIKEKYSIFLYKYSLLNKFFSYYSFLNRKELRAIRLVILGMSLFFNALVFIILLGLDVCLVE